MRSVRVLAIYIAGVFIGGALLAPWLYLLAQLMAHTFPQALDGLFPSVAIDPFHRYVNRCVLLLALVGLWPLLRAQGVTSLREVGLVKPSGQWTNFSGGFLLGFASLAIVATLAIAAGARHIREKYSTGQAAETLLGAAVTAVVVSLLEEILFRGGIFGSLRKVFHWTFGLVLSSLVYSVVHFFHGVKVEGPIHALSGLQLLPHMFSGYGEWEDVVPMFCNLFLAGILLGLAYQRTGNLYFSIGLHAGWIFWRQSYGILTETVAIPNDWVWGTGKLINGWLPFPVLIAALLLFPRLRPARQRECVAWE